MEKYTKRNIIIENIIRETLSSYLKQKTNKKEKMCESLSNFDAPLYHNTDLISLLKMMNENCIKSNYHRGYNKNETHNGICFTRNKNFNPYTYYFVKLTFDTKKLLQKTRGLKLIPYQDSEWDGLDEYEERLVSKNGKPFQIDDINEIITDAYIILDTLCNEIIETCDEYEPYINDIKNVFSHNILGGKLKIIKNLDEKDITPMSLNDAIEYVASQCEEQTTSDGISYETYCVEYYDNDYKEWNNSEYDQNRDNALKTAEKLHKENNLTTRVTFGKYDYIDYEMESIIQQFGKIEENNLTQLIKSVIKETKEKQNIFIKKKHNIKI
jgi:hypothetical protein